MKIPESSSIDKGVIIPSSIATTKINETPFLISFCNYRNDLCELKDINAKGVCKKILNNLKTIGNKIYNIQKFKDFNISIKPIDPYGSKDYTKLFNSLPSGEKVYELDKVGCNERVFFFVSCGEHNIMHILAITNAHFNF